MSLTQVEASTGSEAKTGLLVAASPHRQRPPRRRHGYTAAFDVGGVEGFLTANTQPDGTLGEIWIRVDRQGTPISGLMDTIAIAVSLGLQHGVPLETYVRHYVGMYFEPSGFVPDRDILRAKSLPDYVFRRLAIDFLPYEARARLSVYTAHEAITSA